MKRQKHTRRSVPGILFGILILIFPAAEGLSAGGNIPQVPGPGHILLNRADSLYRAGQWQTAISLYRKAESHFLTNHDTLTGWKCRYTYIISLCNLNRFDSIENLIARTRRMYQPALQDHPAIRSDLLFLQGYVAFKTGNFKSSVSLFTKLLQSDTSVRYQVLSHRHLAFNYFQLGDFLKARDEIRKTVSLEERDTTYSFYFASDLHWMAILYTYFLGDPATGLQYLNRAREQYARAGAGPAIKSKLYNESGTIYMETGDYNKAREYYMMALNNLPSGYESSIPLANIYNNLGIINKELAHYKKAESFYLKSLSIKNKMGIKDTYQTYSNLGNLYMSQGDSEQSDHYFKKAIDNIIQQYGGQNWRLADSYQNYSRLLILGDHPEKGKKYLTKALEIYRHQYGERHPKTARCYLIYELYYWKKGMPDSALYYIQQSLIANSPEFSSEDFSKNPRPEDVLSKDVLLMSLKDKARTLEMLSDTKQNIQYLKEALQAQQEAVDLVLIIRKSFFNAQSKALLAAHEEETYQNAFRLAVRLYQATGNRKYLGLAFRFSEENRATGLLAAIRTNRAITFAGIPDSVVRAETDITTEIGAYQELLYKEQNKASPNTGKTRKYERRIFRLRMQRDSLIHMMEKKYPGYYRLKYNLGTIPAEQAVNRLKKNQAILEYEIIDNKIYIFCLTSGKIHLIINKPDSSLHEYVSDFWEELQQKQFNQHVSSAYFDIVYSSFSLYQDLIRPIDSLIRGKHLIIVPDEMIAEIPFDVLIDHIPDTKQPSYCKLPYLIYQHPITYSYSSTLYFEYRNRRRKFFNRVIAFAPDYPKRGLNLHQIMQIRQSENYRLYPLPYAHKEAEEVSRHTFGRLITGKEANEHFFKTHTAHYDIIHLAMHTILDNQHPLYSKLVFTQPADSPEDGFLNTYEIYSLKFKTNLAVLSACNSGSGKLSKGEGIISLARSFMFAGTPRLVMSLWEVQDKTGATIMSLFYKNLVRGMPVDVALQKAKIAYLKDADPLRSHPYFWAGYQVMGNASPVYYSFYLLIVILTVIIAGVILLIIRRKRNHSSRSG